MQETQALYWCRRPLRGSSEPRVDHQEPGNDCAGGIRRYQAGTGEGGVLTGGPTLDKGLPYPDGDEIIDLLVKPEEQAKKKAEAETLPKALMTDIDVNWLQTVAEGCSSRFHARRRIAATIHFNSMLVDPHNLTGNYASNEINTNFLNFDHGTSQEGEHECARGVAVHRLHQDEHREQRQACGGAGEQARQDHGHSTRPEIYENRKEEIVSRIFGVVDNGHPYIEHIYTGGDWLIGSEIELLDRIQYNDGRTSGV